MQRDHTNENIDEDNDVTGEGLLQPKNRGIAVDFNDNSPPGGYILGQRMVSEDEWGEGRQEGEASHGLRTMLEELQAEFDAFRESSAELEQELERELERVEGRARKAEETLREAQEGYRQTTQRLTQQLLETQKELEELQEHRRQAIQTLRTQEEALEQTAESERRAQAEVVALREALDSSMEQAAISQTELEELKLASEAAARHLYEDLEEAQSELSLRTPVKASLNPVKEVRCGGGASYSGAGYAFRASGVDGGSAESYRSTRAGDGGGGNHDNFGNGTNDYSIDDADGHSASARKSEERRFFATASMEEDSELEMEYDTPRENDGSNKGGREREERGDMLALSASAERTSSGFLRNEEASLLEEELERQLRLSAVEAAINSQVFNTNSTTAATPILTKKSAAININNNQNSRGEEFSSSPPPTLRWGYAGAMPEPSPAGCGGGGSSNSPAFGSPVRAVSFSDKSSGNVHQQETRGKDENGSDVACPASEYVSCSQETKTVVVRMTSPYPRSGGRESTTSSRGKGRSGGRGCGGGNTQDDRSGGAQAPSAEGGEAPSAGRGAERHSVDVGGGDSGSGSSGNDSGSSLQAFLEALADWRPFACCGGAGAL